MPAVDLVVGRWRSRPRHSAFPNGSTFGVRSPAGLSRIRPVRTEHSDSGTGAPTLRSGAEGRSKPSSHTATEDGHGGLFATTHWSVVLAAADQDTPESAAALERLCRTYWYPLYVYIRRRGYGPEDAQDLTQQFFALLLQKDYFRLADPHRGRFRTFLLHALEHFVINEWKKAHRLKRGGGAALLSLDLPAGEQR